MHRRPDLARLAARIAGRPLTRFAPSPTGLLHLGHVVNAIYVWGLARALGGRVILRIEDHDRLRSRPEYEAAILEDLNWLGFEPDHLARQCETPDRYTQALVRLRATAHVYACGCSRKQLDGERYTGHCRRLALPDGPGMGLRVELAPGTETFDDALLGPTSQDPSIQCGDLLVRDRDGQWTYQFSVVVDDLAQGVDLVVRGMDLAPSTGRQLALARLLGRPHPPVFLHHPLVLDTQGQKLSKSAQDTGVAALRAAGHSPAGLIGSAAASVGLVEAPRPLAAREVQSLFLRI